MTTGRRLLAVALVAGALVAVAERPPAWAQADRSGRAVDRLAADRAALGVRDARDERLDFRHLGPDDGLPGPVVTAVVQDALGFVWAGTAEGLVRYDGATMRAFAHVAADSTTPPGQVTTALAASLRRRGASAGEIWVGTTSGLARYDPAREAFTRVGGTADVTALAVDASGGAWAGVRGGGLLHVLPDGRTRRFRHEPGNPTSLLADDVLAVAVDARNGVWVGTSRGVARLAPGSGQVRSFPADSSALAPVSAIAPRAAGGVYVATQGTGVWRLTPSTGRYEPVALPRTVRAVSAVLEDAAGSLWAGTLGDGLWRLVPGGGEAVRYGNRPGDAASLASNEVAALMQDRQGILWVATYDGLDRTDISRGTPTRFRADGAGSLSSNTVLSVLPTADALYVGTARGLDVSTDGRTFRLVSLRGADEPLPVRALAQTPDGTVWAGTDGAGLLRLADGTAESVALPGAEAPVVTALAPEPSGALWVGTADDGLLRVEDGDATRAAGVSREVTSLALTADGAVWAGTPDALCRRPPDADAFACRPPAGVTALAADGDRALWVGTRGGLLRVDPRRADAAPQRYTSATSDLPADGVRALAVGELGLVWIATDAGIARFHAGTGVFTPRPDLLGAAAVSPGALAWRDSLLYAGSRAGLVRANPASLRARNPNAPQVVLTGVDVSGQPVAPGEDAPLDAAAPVAGRLSLGAADDYVTFRFAGLHFAEPSRLTYRYRLVGEHDDWRRAGTLREATYTNLRPRRYTFEVVARSADGVDSLPATLAVVVRPPWYRTWWAYALFAALGIAALVQGNRWQASRTLRAERERLRRREAELRAEAADAQRREAEAEATALKAENDRAAAEIERAREVHEVNTQLASANERLEASLRELQATQAQLVQAEKLASLGQLTAGIAHEIKNPLNFINNFAELSGELVDDLETDLRADPDRPVGEALGEVDDVLRDLRANAARIREHGQRADRIVRSMLLHSRGGSSERARVDVNRYVDEYLNLAYHGARASNADFNVTLVRELAADAGEVEVVPSEFGRVLINLLTNAFHAVHARRTDAVAAGETYAPAVTLRTARTDDGVEIAVADNGTGIPDSVRDHIFEPFFTTKAAGEGTGLGLSLVHDIVTQLHGGTIDVESAVGEGTTFTVRLPDRFEPVGTALGQHAVG